MSEDDKDRRPIEIHIEKKTCIHRVTPADIPRGLDAGDDPECPNKMLNDSCFRFPEEIRRLFKCIVEECMIKRGLGYMEAEIGEVGESFLDTFERAIHDNTQYKHGRDAFDKDNYPHLAPRHLLMFGRLWLTTAIDCAFQDSSARKDLSKFKLEKTAQILEDVAKQCRELDRLIKTETREEEISISENEFEKLKGVCHYYVGDGGGHWAFQDSKHIISESEWRYEGLHILENGDQLTIFSPDDPDKIVWSGTINFKKDSKQLSRKDKIVGSWFCQVGVKRYEWPKWFVDKYPAKLIPVKKK
ncbi:MAG: hypothetical protein HQ536_00810 [Parcubacteria group bacterium]|nr:hypothetical protein [Parcubacteria group bacterium]